jgi:transcription-repair coupling factor (superfamily II helicase)
MHSDDLEEVMTTFVNGQTDVLLSTTIIESGLDIPNANTIIIDRADRFGLSDLYQLRGRVGRYKHQAYAYLLLPRHAGLLTDAANASAPSNNIPRLGSGFKSPCATWKSAARATCSAPNKAATSPPSVSSFTASCSSKASRR